MPIVINEVEILPATEIKQAGAGTAGAAAAEPLHEQLRLLQRDMDARQRRRMAD
jgi:hypothetical protein